MISSRLYLQISIHFILCSFALTAQTIVPGGYVSGIWNPAGSPYIVNDDVLVHGDSTLTVDAGTSVLFTGPYFFEVHGQLLVTGSPTAPVTFDRESETVTWRGIFFNYTDTSMTDSSLIDNAWISHTSGGSCITIHYSSRLRVANCTISNGASFRGGGINCRYSAPLFENLSIFNNGALDGAGMALEGSNAILKSCSIWSNHADGAGGGMVIFENSAPAFENCQVNFNSSFGSGGGVYINDAFPSFTNCEISYNNGAAGGGTSYSGGGVSVKLDSGPGFINCALQNNTSGSTGGGISSFSPTRMTGCLFSTNVANTNGGAIYLGSGNVIESQVYNCTLADNIAPHGSAITCYNHVAFIRNSILWDEMGLSPNSLIYLGSITALDVADIAFSDIQNGKTSIELWQNASYNWGQHNLDADPMLDSNDFSLTWSSPCIEAGTTDTTGLGLPELDLSGMPRIANDIVDIGAYEYQQPVKIPDPGFRIPEDMCVFPNPAREFTFVETDEVIEKGKISLLNASGRVQFEIEMSSQRIMLNTEGLAPGLYFVRFLNDNGASVKKLVIF